MKIPHYPSMNSISSLYPGPQVLLGHDLYWTEKRDGSQLRVWAADGELRVATSSNEKASPQFTNYLLATPQIKSLRALVFNEEAVPDVSDFGPYLVFGELLVKGRSPARFEMHEQHDFVAFDLWDILGEKFVPIGGAYQHCLHFGLPFVDLWGLSRHSTIEDLYQFRDNMIEIARREGREGVVVKALIEGKPVYAKEKLDTPKFEKVSIDKSGVILPALPSSEVLGAIAKVHADIGQDITDKTKAMPMIAQYVSREQAKHMCGKPLASLFFFYQQYLEGLQSCE